jgi:hypothetical protein
LNNEVEPFDYSHDLEDLPENAEATPTRRKVVLAIIGTLVFALVVVGAFLLGAYVNNKDAVVRTPISIGGTGSIEDSRALTETELRDLVLSSKLTAYWAGPIRGYKYAVASPKAGVVVVRYLPDGKGLDDDKPIYRVIGTYVQKGATEAVMSSGKKEGSVGFTNVDGNAVFYVRSRPTNVYMAIKGKDIQVEIFDPGQDQAVALSLFKGQIVQIK